MNTAVLLPKAQLDGDGFIGVDFDGAFEADVGVGPAGCLYTVALSPKAQLDGDGFTGVDLDGLFEAAA